MRKQKINVFVAEYSRYLLLLLLCIGLTIATPNFLSSVNLMNVLRQSALMLIMSLGMLCAMLLGRGVDMSIGSTLALSSCIGALVMTGTPGWGSTVAGVAVALGIGLAAGLLNGFLIAYLKLPAILATFGTREIIRGIAYRLMSNTVITSIPSGVRYIGSGRLFGWLPMPVFIAALLTAVMALMLRYSSIGRKLYIVGANPRAANFSGINVKHTVVFGFVLSSMMAALAGLVYIGRLGAAEPQIGEQFAFQCIGAVAIGGTSFNGGIGGAPGTVIGAIILTLLINGMNLLNISADWQGIATGAVIILAVLLDDLANRNLNRT